MDRPDVVASSSVDPTRPGIGPGDDVVLLTEKDGAGALAVLESVVAYLEQDSA